ncbi:MAG: Ni/Fe hydrogenase subunit alpha [Saprospiraceae bacterium]|nr:Ni/Fe hydrogenase subunit alpha [Saprospiraceae bacterium]
MGNPGRKITIDPVTRVEGHGKVTIHLDEEGRVKESRFHIVEFRGFERFIQGRPYWEVPVLVQRLCGICPVSHHLAASKAIDQLHGLDPGDLSPAADKIRRLLHYAQIFQSHALHFFYLAAPDLLLNPAAPLATRNIVGVAMANKELARRGILMRKFGQEILQALGGKKIHGITAVPGGVHKTFDAHERSLFLKGNENLPGIDTMIEWTREVLDFLAGYFAEHRAVVDTFASFDSGHLGLVGPGGALELYDGRMRAIDAFGARTLHDVPDISYASYFSESVESWTYLKFPYLKERGRDMGWNRVGPLARLNVCDYISTPIAEEARQAYFAFAGGKPINRSLYYHWARIIEMVHCAELIRALLHDPDILSDDLRREGQRRSVGIGVVEAPRGTLIHHYEANDRGMITRCNLIVSTTHNNEAINRAVSHVARARLDRQPEITEPMLNEIEVAIRAYDPCLSCATHAIGKMPLHIQLFDHEARCLSEYIR